MSRLTDFLIENPVDILTDEVVISDRFKIGDEILKFKIKAVGPEEFANIQKKHTKVGKKGKTDFNNAEFQMEIALNYTLDPNFRDADSIKKSGCLTPKQFLNKTLLAGELTDLVKEISSLSGFENDIEDIKEEAKN